MPHVSSIDTENTDRITLPIFNLIIWFTTAGIFDDVTPLVKFYTILWSHSSGNISPEAAEVSFVCQWYHCILDFVLTEFGEKRIHSEYRK